MKLLLDLLSLFPSWTQGVRPYFHPSSAPYQMVPFRGRVHQSDSHVCGQTQMHLKVEGPGFGDDDAADAYL